MARVSSRVLVGVAAVPLIIALPLVAAASPGSPGHTGAHEAVADATHAMTRPGAHAATARAASPASDHSHDAEPAPLPPRIPDRRSGDWVKGQPFQDPPIIASRKGSLVVTLTAMSTQARVGGKLVNARVYAASAYGKDYPAAFAPPTLSVRPGDTLQVNLINRLGEPTNLHTHGFFVSPMGNSDNVYPMIPDGASFTFLYELPKDMAPGSYWYHPHMHGLVEEQVFGGLAGFMHVEGLTDLLPTRLQGITRHYVMLKDTQLTRGNSIPNVNIDSAKPTTRTVNGQYQPVLSMAVGETQLWHIGNMSADIWYKLAVGGMEFTVIAEDGNPVDLPVTTETLELPPAKRFDVLVQATTAGATALRTLRMNTGPQGDGYPTRKLATINVTGTPSAPAALPTRIRPLDARYGGDLSDKTVAQKRTFVLSEDNKTGVFYINGRTWDQNFINATPIKGTVEEWTFINTSFEAHPIHTHVNDMQVMSYNGVAQPFDGWVDTQKIPPATKDSSGHVIPGEVTVRIHFKRYAGAYVFHCHILAHEDGGMMGNVQVTTNPE